MDGDVASHRDTQSAPVMLSRSASAPGARSTIEKGKTDVTGGGVGQAGCERKIVGGPSKRAFDLAVSAAALVFLSPALIVIALSIRATSPGPALFWSQRVGLRGERFMMPKFRTMRSDAPLMARELMADPAGQVTGVGRFLRKTSLDELPQFIPVFLGRMSLIGPRPLLPCDPGALARLDRPCALRARPGISGLAQIRGRNMLTPEKKARYDEAYARNWSWRLDIKIIWQTIAYVILRKDIL
jgi:O-antigen biosynthesis protein WbqP